jgi:hypothetical protein
MKMDLSDEIVIRIRSLQERYSTEHLALVNWGAWSRDRKTIGPRDSKPHIWQEAVQSKFDDYGEDHAIPAERLAQADAKSERPEEDPYNEREGALLDERMHGPGGMPLYLRQLLRVAYVSREVPEYQFPRACGCLPDTFCEGLESALVFVSRFA